MDCKHARLLLNFAHPFTAELTLGEAEALEAHLQDCPECGAVFRAERQADERLGRAMRDVPIPDGLRERILSRLAADRDDRHWRWLRWGSIAAAVALVVGLVWMFTGRPATNFDQEQVLNRVLAERGAAPEEVEAFFAARGIRIVVPKDFNYRYLSFYGMAEIPGVPGKSAPQLVFIKGAETARVFILSDQQFDLDALRAAPPADSGGVTVKILADPANPRVAYLLVFTGGPQMWFRLDVTHPAT
jgi:hypothetical protein